MNTSKIQSAWKRYLYGNIAAEISQTTRYCDQVFYWSPRKDDSRILYDNLIISNSRTEVISSLEQSVDPERRVAFVLNGHFNYSTDIQAILETFYANITRYDRLLVVVYNSYFSGIYKTLSHLGIRSTDTPDTFLTVDAIESICKLAGFEKVRRKGAIFFPFRLLGLGTVLDKLISLVPFVRKLCAVEIITLRPIKASDKNMLLSVVIPARNESGNIERAITVLLELNDIDIEAIFVEGNSTDDTWKTIQEKSREYSKELRIASYQQNGKGKADAVRLGFEKANGKVVTILDADLTMPTSMLPRYFDALTTGKGDLINGSRLVYPQEAEAMRFLNTVGNIFFTKALSYCLSAKLTDTLCGTKMLFKRDYERTIEWRNDFGDFDPFGDYELLFPAAQLGLGIIDVPIKYRSRTYGDTNISRFRHGLVLLRMTFVGLFKILCSNAGTQS